MTNNYTLCAADIDKISDDIHIELSRLRIDEKEIKSIRLSAEECLIEYGKKFGEDAAVTLVCEKHLFSYRISLCVFCASFNPLPEDDDEFMLMKKLTESLSYLPSWTYDGKMNIISFSCKPHRRIPEFLYYVIAVSAAIVFGCIARATAPELFEDICKSYLTPVSNALIGFLSSLALLMLICSIIAGIGIMGNLRTLKKIGLRMILRFIAILFCCLIFVTALSLLFFPLHGGNDGAFDAKALWNLIVDIIPLNIFAALGDGNVLQVIFISVFFGIALLSVSGKVKNLSALTQQINLTVNKMLCFAVKSMPVVVFISIFGIAVYGNLPKLSDIYKYLLIMLICCFAMTAFSVLRVCVGKQISPALLIKKLLPALSVAFFTASSAAAYTSNVDICENKLGIDKSIVKLGIPIGSIVFKPCTIFQPLCGCLCFASLYGIDISLSKLITLMITVMLLAVAQPPTPGILISCFTLLFGQIGVPLEALSLIIALECILDRIGTFTNVLSLQTELIEFSASSEKLDIAVLKKKL